MLLMEHNQNTIAEINHQRPIRIKFQDHSRLFHQSLRKKLAFVERLYFGSRGHALVGVAVLWRLRMKCSPRQKRKKER